MIKMNRSPSNGRPIGLRFIRWGIVASVLVFGLLIASFHFLFHQFLVGITEESMAFQILSYQSPELYDLENHPLHDGPYFQTQSFLVEQSSGKVLSEWLNPGGRQHLQSIRENLPQPGKGQSPFYLTLNQQTYLLQREQVRGVYNGDWIQLSTKDDDAPIQTYDIVAFVNMTDVQRLIYRMDLFIAVLFSFFGLLLILLLYREQRRLQRSFQFVEKQLKCVGARVALAPQESSSYQEINAMQDSIAQMDQLLTKQEAAQQTFFQNASHELRTPLMSIQGYTEGMLHGVITREEALPKILKNSERMGRLVDQLLYFSRLSSKSMAHEPLDLVLVLKQVGERMGANQALGPSGTPLSVTWVLPENLPLLGDEEALDRVVSNLLANALRFAQSRVDVKAWQEEDGVAFSVHNDGSPIPADALPRLFERFYKGKKGQFGIGLSIVADVVKSHGGTISVASDIQDTSFTIHLPTERPKDKAAPNLFTLQ